MFLTDKAGDEALSPIRFKNQRNHRLRAHGDDLVHACQVSMYDKRGERRADSAEFIKDFWQMGREGRESQSRQRIQMARKLNVSANVGKREPGGLNSLAISDICQFQ